MTDIKLKRCYWERTAMYLVFDEDVKLSPEDRLVLDGSRFDPLSEEEPQPCTVTLGNVVAVDEHTLRVRFLVANGGWPMFPGDYQLLVKRGDDTAGVLADPSVGEIEALDEHRTDLLYYARVSSMYAVYPRLVDGRLGFSINAKGFPKSFGYQPKNKLRNALRSFKRSTVDCLAVAAFNLFKKVCPYQEKKILFTSDSRSSLSGNMEPLYRKMQERGICADHKAVFAFKPEKFGDGSRGIGSYLRLAYHLATSGTIFCDDFQPYLYHVRYDKRTRLTQLWHACGAFKTVGFGRIGTIDAVPPFTTDHHNYTDVIVASDHDVPIYAEAFGVSESVVRPLGIPRHDWLLNPQWQEEKRRAFAQTFPQAAGKKVLVFAPTFRGAGKTTAFYNYSHIDFARFAEFCRENGYFLIFKMHPFITQEPPLPPDCDDVFADGSGIREINDILPSTDVLITDYSSVVYEAALLSIPTLYFAYDLEEYVSSRSFYEPFETFASGPIIRDFDTLLATIKDEDFELDKLEAFRKKNFRYLDGGTCDRIVDQIVLRGEAEK